MEWVELGRSEVVRVGGGDEGVGVQFLDTVALRKWNGKVGGISRLRV